MHIYVGQFGNAYNMLMVHTYNDPAFPLLGYFPAEIMCKSEYVKMSITTLFITLKL